MPGRSNVFLVSNPNMVLIVDTGVSFFGSILMRRLRKQLADRKLDLLVLTHSHFDHVANAARVKQEFGCPVAIHRSEAAFLRNGYSPVPRGSVKATKFLNRLDREKIRNLVRTRSVEPDLLIGETLDLSGRGIPVQIHHTPGHSAGSVTVIADNEIAMVGDNMVRMVTGKIFPPFCDDIPALLESWRRMLETGCSLFLPSHGREITRELLQNAYPAQMAKLRTEPLPE